jgi:hypothetical protein
VRGHRSCHHWTFSLTCDEFDRLRERAGGKCELCGIAEEGTPRRVLCIDHDNRYDPRAVRGLICDKCNSHLRFLENGSRPADARVRAYYRSAFFLEVNAHRQGKRQSA